MRIRWTIPAADDLEAIKEYLQQNYPQFAEPTVREIYRRIRLLKVSPHRGRPGQRDGTENLLLHHSPTSWSIRSRPKRLKSCISITVRRTGVDQFHPGRRHGSNNRPISFPSQEECRPQERPPLPELVVTVPCLFLFWRPE
jgi:plasmid stabilization system protein ParE